MPKKRAKECFEIPGSFLIEDKFQWWKKHILWILSFATIGRWGERVRERKRKFI